MKRNWKLLLVLASVAAAAYYLYPSLQFYGMGDDEKSSLQTNAPSQYYDLYNRAINLGLDLQGGIHLVMEVDIDELEGEAASDAVAQAQEVIRNRIDEFGVAEPTIQKQGTNRIIVELPGLTDIERAKNLIGQTALLEFKLLEPYADRDRILDRASTVLTGHDSTASETGETEEGSLFETGAAENTGASATLSSMLARYRDDLIVSQENLYRVKAILAEAKEAELIPSDVEFLFSSKPEGQPGAQFYSLYMVRERPEMTGSIVGDAQITMGTDIQYMGQPIVEFSTTEEGVSLFRRVTAAHLGERLAIVLDGSVYSAPTIQATIRTGRSIITGSGTQEEAKDLAIVLRAGNLPAEVEIIEDRTVGPSLGRDSIEQGKTAAMISMVLVAVFMIAYYRLAGVVAVFALALNVAFVLATLSGFHATLTLPGIAGIILTIGMAVDANVLIFERIREELRSRKTMIAAIDSGYNNALSAIMDANITTFIVGIVLYEFGTGPIRGFALTLCIGIASSLFTAFFITRAIFELLTTRAGVQSLSIGPIAFLAGLKIPFISRRKPAFAASALVLVLGIVSIVAINGLPRGIDFAGGTLLELHFDPPVAVEKIRGALGQVEVDGKTTDLSASEIKEFGGPGEILIRVSESATGTGIADGIKAALKSGFPGSVDETEWIRRQEKVGPKIGEELTGSALRAILVSLALILVYMAFRFRHFHYGIAAVAALFHDVLITLGVLSLFNVEITLAVIAGLLAVVGYSLNDTIVVFDRIRENLKSRLRDGFGALVDLSINECLSRTLVTSVTTLVAVIVLMVWGGEVIRDFTITLMIGILVGTYSSVFVASPILYLSRQRAEKK
jgi:SecD/SecF fusion protein